MLNLYSTQLEAVSLHRVGNKHRAEPLFLSENPYRLNDEISGLLKEFFFKPFREKDYRFQHEAGLEFHAVFEAVSKVFEQPSSLHQVSKDIATHLFSQSNHPHIKSGECYVAYFTDVLLDNEKTDALGIFKSEVKQDFLQFEEQGANLDMLVRQGVNLNRL